MSCITITEICNERLHHSVTAQGDVFTDDMSALQVRSGALAPLPSIQTTEHKKEPYRTDNLYMPAPPRQSVTLALAEGALNRLLATSGAKSEGQPVTVADIERTSMDSMCLAAALLGVQSFGDLAELKTHAMAIRTEGAEKIRQRQCEELQKETDKAIEDQQKAQKAGVFGVVVDWIVSVAELACGVAKMVTGNFAGAAMDFAAGCAGLVKAMCNTLALVDPNNADKYRDIANVAGKIQLSFQIAGMMVDITSLCRGVMASKFINNSAKDVMTNQASPQGQAFQAAITQGSEAAIKTAAAEVGQEVARRSADHVADSLRINIKMLSVLQQAPLIKAFSREAIEEMVTKAVEKGTQKALQSSAGVAARETIATAADELAEAAVAELLERATSESLKVLQRSLIETAMHASLMSAANIAKASTRAGLEGVNGVFQGVITKERAELQKEIQELVNDMKWMQFLLDEYEKAQKRTKEEVSDLLERAGESLAAGSDAQLKTGAMLSSIAANIV